LSGSLPGMGGAEGCGSAYFPGMGGGREGSKTEFRLEVEGLGGTGGGIEDVPEVL
jgi:hypothetical protein